MAMVIILSGHHRAMDNRGMLRALGHSHRQKILRNLEKEPMAYSHLLARVEPERKGRGRFNYHLKVLRDARLIKVAGAQYRLTSSGAAAAQFLMQASKKVVPAPRRRTQLTIIGALIGVGGIGLLLLLSVILAPMVFDVPGTDQVPGWDIPTFVSKLDHEAASPQVAVDPDGNAIAIWTQDDGALINVWANRFVTGGDGWGPPKLIEKDDSLNARSPLLAIDLAGNAWAVWDQEKGSFKTRTEHYVWANRFVPEAGWGEATLIAGGGAILVPAQRAVVEDIALDASGTLTIVWSYSGPNGFAIYADRIRADIGGVGATAIRDYVPSPDAMDGSPNVRLAVDAEGRAIALWWDDGGVYASRYVPDEEWGPAFLVWGGFDPATRASPSIAMDSDGNAIAVWFARVGVDDEVAIYAARFVPSLGWSEADSIELDVTGLGRALQLAVDAEGNAILAFNAQSQVRPSEVDLFAIHYDPGVGWDDPIRIAEKVGTAGLEPCREECRGDSRDFALAMEPAGFAAILYDNKDGGIFAIRYAPGEGWSFPAKIGTGGAQCGECPPSVAVDVAGNIIAVWEDRKSAPFGVLGSRFVEPTPLEDFVGDIGEQFWRFQSWLAVSLSLLVATMVLTGVLFVVYWKPRRGLAAYREIPEDSGRPPGPEG